MDFNNTEIAFRGKNDADLKRSYWLFKIIGWNWLIKTGPFMLKLFMPLWFPVPIIKATIFKQFCGGESITDCDGIVAQLGDQGVKTILDYSVEGKAEETTFDINLKEVLSAIKYARNNPNIPFSVFKPTGFGRFALYQKLNEKKELNDAEQAEFERVKNRFETICEAARNMNVPVFIDAEETWIQDPVDDLALQLMRKYNRETAIVYNTAQLYRKDRLAYLQEMIALAEKEQFIFGVKLVRGAYIEKERARAQEMGYSDPMQVSKEATDKDFDAATALCFEHLDRVSFCCASHNEKSNALLAEKMESKQLAKDDIRIYFAQLLGMSDHISMNLSMTGYNVAKYVPYGPVKDVTPYLIRRAEENTSLAGQTGRELTLILNEQSRRRTTQ